MRLTTLSCFALSLLAGAADAQTKSQPVRSLALRECVRMALEHNLDVQIEQYNPRVNQLTLAGSYGVYDPSYNLTVNDNFNQSPGGATREGIPIPPSKINFDVFNQSVGGTLPVGLNYQLATALTYRRGSAIPNASEYVGSAAITLSQPLLKNFWIDANRETIAINKKNLRSSELSLDFQIMNVLTKVELAYYDLIFAYENVKVQQSALELADRLLAENKKRVEVGALAPLDEKQAQSQVAARRADLLAAQRELATQQNVLKNLLTDDFVAWQDVAITPADRLIALAGSFNLQESWNRGMTTRPDLQQLKVELEKRDIILRFRHNQLFPQLDLTGSFGHNALGASFGNYLTDIRTGDSPSYGVGMVLSIPLGNRVARNTYEAAKLDKQQQLLRYKKLEQDIVVQIDDAIKLAQTQYERVDATRQARLYAEAALDAEQKKLANGKSTSFVVLQLQRDLTAARSAEIRALADYNKALAQLSLNEGSTLERNKLSVEVK